MRRGGARVQSWGLHVRQLRLWCTAARGSGGLLGYQPYAIAYATSGVSGGDHLWRLGLDASGAPAPVQMSSLTIPSGSTLCVGYQGQTNAADPSTTFFILGVSATYPCGSVSYQLVRYTDSASTAPAPVPANVSQFQGLYAANGMMTGLLAWQGDIVFYKGLDFSSPKTLFFGVYPFTFVGYPPAPAGTPLPGAPSSGFMLVRSNGFPTKLYRVDNTGAVSADLYDDPPVSNRTVYNFFAAFDSNNAYLSDYSDDFSSGSDRWAASYLQVPLTGASAAQVLYQTSSATAAPGAGAPTLVGPSGNRLYLTYQTAPVSSGGSSSGGSGGSSGGGSSSGGSSGGSVSTSGGLQTLTIGVPGTPTPVFSLPGEFGFVRLQGGQFFLGSYPYNASTSADTTFNTEVVKPDGTVVQPALANSVFIGGTADSLVQVRGITDTGNSADYGGGMLYQVPVSAPAPPAPLRTADSNVVVVPTGAFACVFGVANGFMTGRFSGMSEDTTLAVDLGRNLVVPLRMTNTTISPAMPLLPC